MADQPKWKSDPWPIDSHDPGEKYAPADLADVIEEHVRRYHGNIHLAAGMHSGWTRLNWQDVHTIVDALRQPRSSTIPEAGAISAPVTLAECPVGLFLNSYGDVCLKSEYRTPQGAFEAYIAGSGEFFWGDNPQTVETQHKQMVRPVDEDALLAALSVLQARS